MYNQASILFLVIKIFKIEKKEKNSISKYFLMFTGNPDDLSIWIHHQNICQIITILFYVQIKRKNRLKNIYNNLEAIDWFSYNLL